MTIAVVGAGVAGLYVAREVAIHTKEKVILLESKSNVGGRVSTERDTVTREVLFERGPWRVAKNHSRVLALCAELGIELFDSTQPPKHHLPPKAMPGLSIWDINMLESMDPSAADKKDRETGYPGQTQAASGSSPYVTDVNSFFVAPDGLDLITNELEKGFVKAGGQVRLNTMVDDVLNTASGYKLRVSERIGHNNFKHTTLSVSRVIVCVSPHAWQGWTVAKYCTTVIDAVDSMSLYHIYSKSQDAPRKHTLKRTGQRIPSQYGNQWHQVMYSSGRLADFWYRMRLSQPAKFAKLLGHSLRNISGYHCQHAIHLWRPVFGFNLEQAVSVSVEPNPTELPGLYLANESHSSHQGWMEGSLEMAQRVLNRIMDNDHTPRLSKLPKEYLVVEGWVIDVSKWKKVHPGSAAAIKNHLGENATALFNHIGHSVVARATVHSLKRFPQTFVQR
jgi:hypothetical protein